MSNFANGTQKSPHSFEQGGTNPLETRGQDTCNPLLSQQIRAELISQCDALAASFAASSGAAALPLMVAALAGVRFAVRELQRVCGDPSTRAAVADYLQGLRSLRSVERDHL